MPADVPVRSGLQSIRRRPRCRTRITAEGRVVAYPGGEVTVGTEVLGTIINMPVREKAAVHKGDLLVELRADEVRASLREAQHRLTEAEAGLRLEQAPLAARPDPTPRHGQGAAAAGRRVEIPHRGPRPPRRRQGGRRAPGSRVGQVPHRRADRRRGHRAPRRPRRDSQPRRAAGDDRRPEPAARRGRGR